MNKFAGNLTFKGVVNLEEVENNLLEIEVESGDTVVYVHGDTDFESSKDLIDSFKKYGEILYHDISISTDDKLAIMSDDFGEGIYELATFEGVSVTYDEILDRFNEVYEVLSIREAEVSNKYGNRIIKVDFVY
ncbi:MAG: hypothetical protein PHH06_04845 [Candidatus Gracilibacteria bacterium]|nr:hypothetical protein [Candidatus Gracilibacteria bacterium]